LLRRVCLLRGAIIAFVLLGVFCMLTEIDFNFLGIA